MSLLLALECSTTEGSLALAEWNNKSFNCRIEKKWTHQAKLSGHSHSDKIPLEIDRLLKEEGQKLSDLKWLAVGTGPGRWTGVRTAINAIRALSFSLNIPVYSVNSLRICAELFLSQSQPVWTAFNGFKNQVYCAKFDPKQDGEERLSLLTFTDWLKQMEEIASNLKGEKPVCISDLENFYPLPQNLKTAFTFKKMFPSARDLVQIVFREKEKRSPLDWFQLKAFYLRSPLD